MKTRKTTRLSNAQVWTLFNRFSEMMNTPMTKTQFGEEYFYLVKKNDVERTRRYLEKLKEEM